MQDETIELLAEKTSGKCGEQVDLAGNQAADTGIKSDWESIAWEMAHQLNMALTKLSTNRDWTGVLLDRTTGETYTWEESFIRSIERIPGCTVDRRWIEAKYLPAKARRKAYAELHAEAQNRSKGSAGDAT